MRTRDAVRKATNRDRSLAVAIGRYHHGHENDKALTDAYLTDLVRIIVEYRHEELDFLRAVTTEQGKKIKRLEEQASQTRKW
jgi:hypothetical protein